MSFILDALKKSEIDRQQQGGAEFAALPVSPRPASVPRWLLVVGLLLVINLVVLVGLLLRANPSPTQATPPPVEQSRPEPIAESLSQPSFEQQVAAAKKRLPEQAEAVEPVEDTGKGDKVPDVASPAVQAVLISQNPSQVPASDRYPSLQEVRASGKIQLPDLHLDIHVYSATPKDRFVFINMSKLREGSRLDEGPVVVEITPDGVVLEHQGQHFLLPRE